MSSSHITDHFTWAEAACHDGTAVPTGLQPNARRLAAMAERIRTRFGGAIIPVSWYRTPDWNHRVGGAVGSRHMCGDAMDARPPDMTELLRLIQCIHSMEVAGELPELGGIGTYPGWVHIDCRPRPESGHVARWTGLGVGSEV